MTLLPTMSGLPTISFSSARWRSKMLVLAASLEPVEHRARLLCGEGPARAFEGTAFEERGAASGDGGSVPAGQQGQRHGREAQRQGSNRAIRRAFGLSTTEATRDARRESVRDRTVEANAWAYGLYRRHARGAAY
jgi:hypothetical protein